MNIYFIGMCIAMALYIVIGLLVSRKVKSANDFYVAGRRAPMLLIAGSIIASYASTGMFMGDAAQCYDGVFSPIMIFAGMQSAGYIVGAIFFGRYLRRSQVMTIPQFFGKRFCSRAMQILAAVTAIIMMTVYLLSVTQGIGTLIYTVTGVDYNLCVILSVTAFTILTVASGSRGVLITDTIMASIFTIAQITAVLMIANKGGGWFISVQRIASNPQTSQLLSWGGIAGPLYNTGAENIIWGLIYGVVWMSVCMVGPWQSSRYLMAKNEHAVIRSAPVSAIGVFLMEFLVGMSAVMVRLFNSNMEDSSHVMIWAAMNILPTFLGVVLLVGVLSAGISSATTFLSLIGSSFANDIITSDPSAEAIVNEKRSMRVGRLTMVVVSIIVLIFAVMNPPSIFWIMFLGGSIAACSWMPVALASIFSKRVTRAGAFSGMLCGLLGCFVLKMYSVFANVTLPVYLEPSFIGIICNILVLVVVSALTNVTSAETAARETLFVMPDEEKDAREIHTTKQWSRMTIMVGILVTIALITLWCVPYYFGISNL